MKNNVIFYPVKGFARIFSRVFWWCFPSEEATHRSASYSWFHFDFSSSIWIIYELKPNVIRDLGNFFRNFHLIFINDIVNCYNSTILWVKVSSNNNKKTILEDWFVILPFLRKRHIHIDNFQKIKIL